MRSVLFWGGALSVFLMALPSYSQIQSNITKIEAKLTSAQGKDRYDLLNDLAWEYRFADPDTSIILSNQAFVLGEAIKIEKDLARSLNIIGIANNYSGNKIIAYEYYIRALELAKRQSDSIQIAYTYNNLGRIFQEQGLMNKAFPNITMASEIFTRLNDSTGLAYCYQSLGNLYQAQRNYEKSAENYLKALALRVRLHNQRNIQGGYQVVGRLYAEQGLVDASMEYLFKADSVGRIQGDEIQLAETWVYLAKNYLAKGIIPKADSMLKVSLQIIREKKSVRILSNALLMGAQVAMAQGNPRKAQSLLEEALANAKRTGDRSITQDLYYQLWKLNEKQNNKQGALYHQNQYLLIRDTLKGLDVARQEDELNFEREILGRETENQKLKIENRVIEQRHQFQTVLFGCFILFILVVGILMWVNLRRMKSISRQLAKKNDMLLQLNYEKDSLMSIVAHDLKSPLNKIQGLSSLLKMDGELSDNQKQYVQLIDQVVRDGLFFISDLLSVHALEEQRVPEISEFDAAEVIRNKMDAALGVAESKKIRLKQFLQSVKVKSDKDYLGRITDNLVSNAIKFSPEQSEVVVSLEKKDNQFLLVVQDKGPGFTEQDKTLLFKKFKKLSARPTAGESSNGLGLAIVKTLVDRLGGTIDIDSVKGQGTKFIVTLPLMAA